LNNEYRARLSKAGSSLDLLERLLTARGENATPDLQAALRDAQAQIAALESDHRGWRYSLFYEDAANKRMVQDAQAVQRALTAFFAMCEAHARVMWRVMLVLTKQPDPDPHLTQLPNGDLWQMAQVALDNLATFVVAPAGSDDVSGVG
jgi:hypothetical protein